MYVSYLLEKDGASMYPGSVRHAGGLNLAAAQNFVGAPQYSDYGAYHVPAGIGLDNAQSPGSPWPGAYGAPLRDDWNGYGQGGVPGAGANAVHGPSGAAGLAYSPVGDYHPHPHHHHPAQGPPAPPCGVPASGGLMQPLNSPPGAEHLSPGGQRRNPCDWIRKPTAGGPGENLVSEQAGKGEEDQQEEVATVSARGCAQWIRTHEPSVLHAARDNWLRPQWRRSVECSRFSASHCTVTAAGEKRLSSWIRPALLR
ncbi:homeobox protein CDX-2 isoform X2 [Podarcis raffonei]|uniref:homeobox protein CDX-2 isoform X2 n=1 Tax=Podarcis raffonei TaxID=65483 RepID=UPI00232945C8|nr:homeobox protein CDX-2 isoform X2 [Podarcis raffonei]